MTTPGEARERLSELAYTTFEPGNPLGLAEEALRLGMAMAPLEQRLRQAQKEGLIRSESLGLQIDEAVRAKVINRKEADALRNYHDKVSALLAVDDFAPEDLIRSKVQPADKPRKKAAKRKARPRKKVARKKKTSKA